MYFPTVRNNKLEFKKGDSVRFAFRTLVCSGGNPEEEINDPLDGFSVVYTSYFWGKKKKGFFSFKSFFRF